MNLPQLSEAFLTAETNKGLSAIEAQTQAVSQPVLNYYANTLATGSGENGTILLTDILGTAVGTNITNNIGNCVTIINTLYDAGELGNLITIYNNIYGNINDEAIVGNLITDAGNEIANIIVANPAETADLNTYFSAISAQITKEAGFQIKAGMDVGNTQGNSQTSIQSFVSSLPGYGIETKIGGTAQYLEDVAVLSPTVVTTYIGLNSGNIEVGNTVGILPGDVVIDNPYFTTIAVANVVSANILTMTGNTTGNTVSNAQLTFVKKPGQTIVSTLREGRTTTGLQTAGVGTAANSVDATPTTPPPQATLLPSVVSEGEACSQVIY
jgi:hypothetical protein